MNVVKTLTTEEQLVVRNLQVAAQAARIKVHEYQTQIEAELRKLEQDAIAKGQAVAAHLTNLAREAKLEVEKTAFDFDSMVFHQPGAPVPPVPPPPAA